MLDNIGMTVLAANGVWWTAEVENVFAKIRAGNERAMKEYLVTQNGQLDALVVKVREWETKMFSVYLTKILRFFHKFYWTEYVPS